MPGLKGGRGHKAPYETTHIRVPVPIKEEVDKLVNKYKECVLQGDKVDINFSSVQSDLISITPDDAIQIAQSILKQKKSAKASLEKLLTALYGQEIKL